MARNRYAFGRPAPQRRQPLQSMLAALPTTFLWVSVFISTAVLSASLGYVFGQRALSGVSSPVSGGDEAEDGEVEFRDPRTIPLLNEQEIIARSEQRLAPSPLPTPSPTPTPVPSPTPTPTPERAAPGEVQAELRVDPPSPTPAPQPSPTPVPVAAAPTPTPLVLPAPQSQAGISLQVLSIQQQGGEVVLNVAMQNRSQESVSFLYSFMNVTDDRGRPISASAQGLPRDLPPNGEVFQGSVRVPVAALRGSSSLSLSLTDYPAAQRRLQVNGIPLP